MLARCHVVLTDVLPYHRMLMAPGKLKDGDTPTILFSEWILLPPLPLRRPLIFSGVRGWPGGVLYVLFAASASVSAALGLSSVLVCSRRYLLWTSCCLRCPPDHPFFLFRFLCCCIVTWVFRWSVVLALCWDLCPVLTVVLFHWFGSRGWLCLVWLPYGVDKFLFLDLQFASVKQ